MSDFPQIPQLDFGRGRKGEGKERAWEEKVKVQRGEGSGKGGDTDGGEEMHGRQGENGKRVEDIITSCLLDFFILPVTMETARAVRLMLHISFPIRFSCRRVFSVFFRVLAM